MIFPALGKLACIITRTGVEEEFEGGDHDRRLNLIRQMGSDRNAYVLKKLMYNIDNPVFFS
jgi:hypothetical protein